MSRSLSFEEIRGAKRERNISKDAVIFPVKSYPLQFVSHLANEAVTGDPGVSIVRTDTMEIIKNVSSDYNLICHADVLNAVEKAFSRNGLTCSVFDIRTGGTRGNKMYAEYALDAHTFEVNGDKFHPFIQVRNSYDKSLLFGLRFGLYRDRCSNGCLMGVKYSQSLSLKHLGESIDLQEQELKLDLWVSELKTNSIQIFTKMKETKLEDVNIETLIEKLFERKRDRQNLLDSGIIEQNVEVVGSNAYALFNAVTQYATHAMSGFSDNYDHTMKVFNNLANDNELWRMN